MTEKGGSVIFSFLKEDWKVQCPQHYLWSPQVWDGSCLCHLLSVLPWAADLNTDFLIFKLGTIINALSKESGMFTLNTTYTST